MTAMKKILVIEDEKELAEMMKIVLEKEGYSIELAGDGEEGLNKAKALKPDLITLDVMMPKMNGYEVCNQLKSDEQYKHIPILMFTAKTKKDEVAAGLVLGADEYLDKASDRDILLSKIKSLLKK